VYIGLYYRGQTWCRELHMHADRERVRLMTALTALDMARRAVLALPIRECDHIRGPGLNPGPLFICRSILCKPNKKRKNPESRCLFPAGLIQ
jgi:hypothetical protein